MKTDDERTSTMVFGLSADKSGKAGKSIFWGMCLIVLGVVLMLARWEYVDLPHLWRLWPIVMIAIGFGQLFERRLGAALGTIGMGLAFFAAEFRWMGLSYRTFWPLLIISVGVGMVVRAFTREDDACARKEA